MRIRMHVSETPDMQAFLRVLRCRSVNVIVAPLSNDLISISTGCGKDSVMNVVVRTNWPRILSEGRVVD